MSRHARRMLTYALLVGAIPLLTVACPFLILKLDIKNQTFFTLSEFNLSLTSSTDWGDNLLDGAKVEPGEKYTVTHISPGTYDWRSQFWTKDAGIIEEFNLSDPLIFGTLNICLTHSQYTSLDDILTTWTEVL